MSTFSELIDSTILYLSGFTSQQDRATYITENVGLDDLTISVDEGSAVTRGIVEIDSEIIQVDKVDRANNTLTIPPYGRGFRGTEATVHAAGSRIAAAPQFPRHTVKQALHDAILAVYPDVYAVWDEEIESSAVQTDYPLAHENARTVLKVDFQTVGPSLEWLPARRYELHAHHPEGSRISIYDRPVPGYTIRVRTAGPPELLTDETQDFALTGLPASAEDLVRLGAAYRLVPNVEIPMLSGLSAQADFAANMRPVGASERLGKYMLGLYQNRLQEVRRQQQMENPIRAHYER